jgi:hypothetical protein
MQIWRIYLIFPNSFRSDIGFPKFPVSNSNILLFSHHICEVAIMNVFNIMYFSKQYFMLVFFLAKTEI